MPRLLIVAAALCGALMFPAGASAAPPANDNFASATLLASSSSVPISGTNVDATTEPGENNCCWAYNSVWLKWTAPKTGNYRLEICGAPFNSHLRVYRGTAVNALDEVAENDDAPGCGPDGKSSSLTFIAGAGQEYKFQIGSHVAGQTNTFSGSLNLVSPGNDFFADATQLQGTAVPINGTSVDATTEAGEDNCCWVYNSVWFKWTAPKTGNYRLDVCGASYNTHLKVFTGTTVTALQRIAENDDAPGCGPDGSRSRLTFVAGAGQEYRFQFGSHVGGQTGEYSGALNLVSPGNDFFADATPLSGATAPFSGTNVDASTEQGEPCCAEATVWYRWTAPAAGQYRVETCASTFRTGVSVLQGNTITALQRIAGSSGASACGPAGDRGAVIFTAGAGAVYYLQVGSGADPRGTITGSIAPVAGVPVAKLPAKAVKAKRKGSKIKVIAKGVLDVGTARATVCPSRNTMRVTVRRGSRVLAFKTMSVSNRCTFSRTITLRRSLVGRRTKRLTVVLEYAGSAGLKAAKRTYSAKISR